MSNQIGLIAEDDSDVDVIDELIRKLVPHKTYSIKKYLGHGCGKIRGKCFQWATDLGARGCTMLILLHDLDNRATRELEFQLRQALTPCPITKNIIVIPIREIEAWLLSDSIAIKKAMNLRHAVARIPDPQSITDPKKKLGDIVYLRSDKTKRYVNAVHNRKIAAELDLRNVRRCSSFLPLEDFLTQNIR